MAVRTLDQIVAELRPTYDPQVKSLQERAGLIPQQIQAEEQGLNAKKDVAFGDILDGARRRGLGFAGIPLAEQARYTSTDYLPALARLRQSGQERAQSLQDAILGINERRDTLAQQIRQGEVQRDYDAQQNELNRRAQRTAAVASAASPTTGDLARLFGGGDGQAARPQVQRNAKGGYQFFDAYGTPINAAEYVQLYQRAGGQMTYRSLLQRMADSGDANAKIALRYVGDDFKFNKAPKNLAGALGAVGASGQYASATPQRSPYDPRSGYQGNVFARTF